MAVIEKVSEAEFRLKDLVPLVLPSREIGAAPLIETRSDVAGWFNVKLTAVGLVKVIPEA